jgi:hypothetical protein
MRCCARTRYKPTISENEAEGSNYGEAEGGNVSAEVVHGEAEGGNVSAEVVHVQESEIMANSAREGGAVDGGAAAVGAEAAGIAARPEAEVADDSAGPSDPMCMANGCLSAIDRTVCGSAFCAEHEHHPVGEASFEVVRQVLVDLRESTDYSGWHKRGTDCKQGWDKLETYTAMEDLGREVNTEGVYGVKVKDGRLVTILLQQCNLSGHLPPSLAKLCALQQLNLYNNHLRGFLPAHIGSASCLPLLQELNVRNNSQLAGTIDAHFLANCKTW